MPSAFPSHIILPDVPVLVTNLHQAVWLDTDGELHALSLAEAAESAKRTPALLCHRPALAGRLGMESLRGIDLLELFAFVLPTRFCVPTPNGVAQALGLTVSVALEDQAETLLLTARRLLEILTGKAALEPSIKGLAWSMAQAGWGWGPPVLAALGLVEPPERAGQGFRVWERLPEWEDQPPDGPPGCETVTATEARERLTALLGPDAMHRQAQADYASAVAQAFQPRERVNEPHVLLVEAGTGTGKTLGYIAPASVWVEKNKAPVWISTYTRNLQRQLDGELSRLFPDPAEKARRVVIRKGRENYLCLLNYEDQVMRGHPEELIATGIVARWLTETRDGDLTGGDFPGWLPDLLGRGRTLGLADRRGECIFSACPHFRKCVIEKAVRRAKHADIVVANHALVMVQAAQGRFEEGNRPLRYVFDEGHHVFDAADSAFSSHLTGGEAAEMRRWLLGNEGEGGGPGRSRARGLRRRCEGLLETSGGAVAAAALEEGLMAARALPGPGWWARIAADQPASVTESFLAQVRQHVLARSQGTGGGYSLETPCLPLLEGMGQSVTLLCQALIELSLPLTRFVRGLEQKLDDEAAELESATRARIEGLVRSLEQRVLLPLAGWTAMLRTLSGGGFEAGGGSEAQPEAEKRLTVDWFAVERIDGRDADVGMYRHWIDPTLPFAKTVLEPAHGVLITSATLQDGSGSTEADWVVAEQRAGIPHLLSPAVRGTVMSPFDYTAATRVLVVSDVPKTDMAQVAAAYRVLFLAAGGGGLGLFTAISRLKDVYRRIQAPLGAEGLGLLAQHIDTLDTGTLVDIFRAEENTCLLGTDAVRDGIDVPGRALRLIVFDRVPWPRPDLLHQARRNAFGGRGYDDMLARLRLKQAFGRLIRREGDQGVFVLLDPTMPSRLKGAFPEGVTVEKVGLAEAVRQVREFIPPPAG